MMLRRRYFRSCRMLPGDCACRYYGQDRETFALYSKPGADGLTIPDGLKVNKYLFTDKELYVSQQIFDNNVIVGTVFLESDLSELRDIIRTKYELAVPLFL